MRTSFQDKLGSGQYPDPIFNRIDSDWDGVSQSTIDYSKWRVVSKAANDTIAMEPGTAAGSSFLRIILSPFSSDSMTELRRKTPLLLPLRASLGISLSNRANGEFFTAEFVSIDNNGDMKADGSASESFAISGDITVATNVWTINTVADHTLNAGDLLYLRGCQDSRLNVGLVTVTSIVTRRQFTITSTLANATYTVGASGFVEKFNIDGGAKDTVGLLYDGTTTANARPFSKGDMCKAFFKASTAFTTAYTTPVVPTGYAGPYTIALQPTAQTEFLIKPDRVSIATAAIDGTSTPTSTHFSGVLPNAYEKYTLRLRAYAQGNRPIPVGGGIVSISKAGTTTCTVNFRSAHGLTTSDFITIYGVRDQTNFINTTTPAAVLSTPSSTQITCTIAGTGTATSYGGYVVKNPASYALPGISNIAIQSVSSTTAGELIIVCNANASLNVGDYVYAGALEKSDGSGTFATTGWAEGYYKVLKSDSTTFNVILQVPGLSTFGSTNVGGALIKCSEMRIHWKRVMDYHGFITEIQSGFNFGDGQGAIAVNLAANGAGSTTQAVAGAAAHDAAISGNPVRIGGRALTANYAAVATGDTSDFVTDLVGGLIIQPYSIPEARFQATDSITNSTTATQLKAATASNKNYITGLSIAHATLGAAMEIQLRTTPVASTTATISSNTLVMSATYGWKVGDLIYVTASTVTGLTAGNYYYLLTVSTTSLTFSATRGGGTLSISGSSVSATLSQVLWRTQLQTTALALNHIPFDVPVQGGVNLAVEMCTPTAQTGRIDFNVQGYVAP